MPTVAIGGGGARRPHAVGGTLEMVALTFGRCLARPPMMPLSSTTSSESSLSPSLRRRGQPTKPVSNRLAADLIGTYDHQRGGRAIRALLGDRLVRSRCRAGRAA